VTYRPVDMATLRDLRKRLKAVKNTEKITKAMKMVAASKLRRAQMAILQARPYALHMDDVLKHIVTTTGASAHPLLAFRVPRHVEIVVMSSNRGLCGSFNSNIIRTAERWMASDGKKFSDLRVSAIGRKAREHFTRKRVPLAHEWEDVWERMSFERANEIADGLASSFTKHDLDAVYLLYNEFKSAISQKVTLVQLLPIRPLEGWEENPSVKVGELAAVSGDVRAVAGRTGEMGMGEMGAGFEDSPVLEVEDAGFEHLYEPTRNAVLDTLLPQHLAVQIWRAMLESTAAEHGARMSAMDAASRNAKELIGKLTLKTNRARQAAITTELMEIVSGAEALKG
jgi:F-type H+-transporting ATPase subunit gamma